MSPATNPPSRLPPHAEGRESGWSGLAGREPSLHEGRRLIAGAPVTGPDAAAQGLRLPSEGQPGRRAEAGVVERDELAHDADQRALLDLLAPFCFRLLVPLSDGSRGPEAEVDALGVEGSGGAPSAGRRDADSQMPGGRSGSGESGRAGDGAVLAGRQDA